MEDDRGRVTSVAIIAVLFLLAAADSTLAQSSEPGSQETRVVYGVKAGPAFYGLGSEGFDFRIRTGIAGGFYIATARSSRVGAVAEALFVSRGATRRRSNGETQTWKLSALEVPVLLRLNALGSSGSDAALFVVMGPAIDVRLKSEVSLNAPTTRFDFSAVIGMGLQVGRWSLEARYTRGLRDLTAFPDSIKSRSASVLLGFQAFGS